MLNALTCSLGSEYIITHIFSQKKSISRIEVLFRIWKIVIVSLFFCVVLYLVKHRIKLFIAAGVVNIQYKLPQIPVES